MTVAVAARLRLGAAASRAVSRLWLGDVKRIWCDFTDEGTGAAVDVSSVTATVWLPGGAELDPALTATEESAGTWYIDLPLTYAGAWSVRMACSVPTVGIDALAFQVDTPVPVEGAPPAAAWSDVDAMRLLAEAAADQAAASEAAAAASEAAASASEGAAAASAADADAIAQVYGVPVEAYGAIDSTGATDAAAALNAAFIAAATAKVRLYVRKGTYRLDSQLNVATDLDVEFHPKAEMVAYFNTMGRGGVVGMSEAAWSAAPGVPLKNIKIKGGIWRRNGTLSGDGLTWTGNTGNVFSFWAENVEISDLRVTGYAGGRAFLYGGRDWIVDNVRVANPDNYLGLPCPGIGGTGAFRWFSGGPLTATRLYAVCGDDAFQVVPGATDDIGVDAADITYADSYGVSLKGRLCVVGLVVPDRLPEEIQNSQTMSIGKVTFRSIRGRAKVLASVMNTDSSGDLGPVLFDDVKAEIITDLDGSPSIYAVDLLGADGTAGIGPLVFRECGLLNVIEGGVRLRGTEVGSVEFYNWTQPAPSNAASAYYPMHIQDATAIIMEGGSVAGAETSTKSVIYLGRTDAATNVEYARFEGVKITGIPDGRFGVYGPTYGFLSLDMRECRLFAASGATDAGAVRFSENSASGTIADNDLRGIGATAFANVPAGVVFRGNKLSAATINGQVYQSVAAAATVAWDGRSTLIRLTSSAAATIDTISVPAGQPISGIPAIALMGVNNNTITLSANGNIHPAGTVTKIELSQSVMLVYDWLTEKWLQVGQHGVKDATNSQSAAGGTLTWAENRRMIRINGAGTVTAISGTPTEAVLLTLLSATTGAIIQNNSSIRLTPAANVTLDTNESVLLQYDHLAGYWVQVGGGQR